MSKREKREALVDTLRAYAEIASGTENFADRMAMYLRIASESTLQGKEIGTRGPWWVACEYAMRNLGIMQSPGVNWELHVRRVVLQGLINMSKEMSA
jgi:hypothetical protein